MGTPGLVSGMVQRYEQEWAEPCLLPRLAHVVDGGTAIRNAAGALLDPSGFRSTIDHVLAAFAPHYRENITRYYNGKGGSLRKLVAASELASLDARITRTVVARAEQWSRIKAEAEARGRSTKAAAEEFAVALEATGQLE